MAKLSIRLPDKMKQFVDDQTQSGQFANEEAYIQDLIGQEQDRQRDVARVQGIVDEGSRAARVMRACRIFSTP